MKSAIAIVGVIFALFLGGRANSEEADVRQTHLQYLKNSGVIVDVCVYEQEYLPPKDGEKEAAFIRRAVVTDVHKGSVKVGAKIEIVQYVVHPPEWLAKFRSVVEGELLTYCYFGDELPALKNGRHVVDHNQLCFDRCTDEDVKAFLKSLRANSVKNNQSEQPGADQPATRPADKVPAKTIPSTPTSKDGPR
jgi:hypothetical protein